MLPRKIHHLQTSHGKRRKTTSNIEDPKIVELTETFFLCTHQDIIAIAPNVRNQQCMVYDYFLSAVETKETLEENKIPLVMHIVSGDTTKAPSE